MRRGQYVSFLATSEPETVIALMKQHRPNVVLLPQEDAARGCGALLARVLEAAGFRRSRPGAIAQELLAGDGVDARPAGGRPGLEAPPHTPAAMA